MNKKKQSKIINQINSHKPFKKWCFGTDSLYFFITAYPITIYNIQYKIIFFNLKSKIF